MTELPYLVGPERVVSRITELVGAGRLPAVSGVADLSDMDGLRLQIDLKPGADAGAALADLHRFTPLEETLNVNNVVLVDGVPTTVGLRELCEHYVAHRLVVVVRRTRHRLRRADERLHIVEGLIAALDNIDEVVALIRGSKDAAEARAGLVARFGLTEVQANHILDMALRRLTALERQRLDEEAAALRSDIADFKEILASTRRQRSIVRKELRRIVEDHGRPRRSRLVAAEVADRELAAHSGSENASAASDGEADPGPDLPCVVTVSTSGNIGRASLKGSRRASPGRHDLIAASVVASTGAPVAAVTSLGRAFTVLGGEIEEAANRIRGVAASSVFGLESGERVLALVAGGDDRLVIVTAGGTIKRIEADEVLESPPGVPADLVGGGRPSGLRPHRSRRGGPRDRGRRRPRSAARGVVGAGAAPRRGRGGRHQAARRRGPGGRGARSWTTPCSWSRPALTAGPAASRPRSARSCRRRAGEGKACSSSSSRTVSGWSRPRWAPSTGCWR